MDEHLFASAIAWSEQSQGSTQYFDACWLLVIACCAAACSRSQTLMPPGIPHASATRCPSEGAISAGTPAAGDATDSTAGAPAAAAAPAALEATRKSSRGRIRPAPFVAEPSHAANARLGATDVAKPPRPTQPKQKQLQPEQKPPQPVAPPPPKKDPSKVNSSRVTTADHTPPD